MLDAEQIEAFRELYPPEEDQPAPRAPRKGEAATPKPKRKTTGR